MTANLQASGPVLKLDALQGAIEGGPVTGSVSISFASSKPFIDANLQSERLDLTGLLPERSDASRKSTSDPQPARDALWSDRPIDLLPLRLFEADLKVRAREVWFDKVRIAPAELEVTLLDDTLSISLAGAALYGGNANGSLVVNASHEIPDFAVRLDLAGLEALPF